MRGVRSALLGVAAVLGGASAAPAAVTYTFTGTVGFGAIYGGAGGITDLGGASLAGTLTLDEGRFAGAAGQFLSAEDGAFGLVLRFARQGMPLYMFDFSTLAGTSDAAIALQDEPDEASFVLNRAGDGGAASLSMAVGGGGAAFLTGVDALPASLAFTGLGGTSGAFDIFLADGTAVSGDFAIATLDAGGGVPEPETWLMLAIGFAVTGGALRRRRTAFVSASA